VIAVAGWILATVAALVVGHWWIPAYVVAFTCALMALAAHERRPARRRWRDSKRVGKARVR
jgi:CHASE2 domain-containing sensor protein